MINKIKKFFTEKPEGNIWKRATIYLILLRYIGPIVLIFSLYLMVGLAAPEADISEAAAVASESIANIYVFALTTMFEAGQSIAINNPILSKVLFFLLGNVIWVIYAGIAYLIIDIIRHITSWVYNKQHKMKSKGGGENEK